LSDSSFAPPGSELGTPSVGTLQVAAYPTAGQGLALDAKGKIPAGLLSSGGFAVIDDLTVSGSVLASYDTNTRLGGNIPATYKDLILRISGKCDQATRQFLSVQINGDTGSNYYSHELHNSTASAMTGTEFLAISAWVCGAIAKSAGLFSTTELTIPDYASTTFKKGFRGEAEVTDDVTTTNLIRYLTGGAHNTIVAAVTRLVVTTSGNFAVGTRFTLYGRG
jgi:hypothetical protein